MDGARNITEEVPTFGGDDDYSQITVWQPDADNKVHVWMESEDGECSHDLTVEERRWLIARLSEGLD